MIPFLGFAVELGFDAVVDAAEGDGEEDDEGFISKVGNVITGEADAGDFIEFVLDYGPVLLDFATAGKMKKLGEKKKNKKKNQGRGSSQSRPSNSAKGFDNKGKEKDLKSDTDFKLNRGMNNRKNKMEGKEYEFKNKKKVKNNEASTEMKKKENEMDQKQKGISDDASTETKKKQEERAEEAKKRKEEEVNKRKEEEAKRKEENKSNNVIENEQMLNEIKSLKDELKNQMKRLSL